METVGALVVTLRSHRLSENDICSELFFIFPDIAVPLPQLGTLLLL